MPFKDPEKRKAQVKRFAKMKQDLVYEHYGSVCNCCGESNKLFLTIDHINNDGHKYKGKSGNRWSTTRMCVDIIKKDFPDDIQILCMNCNFGKFRNKGVCPHEVEVID